MNAASDAPSTNTSAHPTIVLLSLAAFVSASSLRVTDAMLPKIASDLHVMLGSAASAVTSFAVMYGLMQAVYGPVGDRYGKLRVVGWGCIAMTITSILCGLATSAPMLIAARALAGATAAAIIPLSMAWIGDVVPYAERQPVLARFLLGQICGLAAGQAIGGVAAQYFNWRIPFFLIALWALVVGIVLWRARRRSPELRTPRTSEAPWREMGAVFALPWARVILITTFLEGAFLFGPFAFFATHLNSRFGLSLSSAGLVIMCYSFGGLIFAFKAGTLVSKLGEPGLALGGGLLLWLALLAIGASPVWWSAIPGAVIAGLGYYMWHNTLQTNATQMAPTRRGAAVASFASAFFLGQSAGVAVCSAVVERVGTGSLITIGGSTLPFIAGGFAWLRWRRLQAQQVVA